MAVRWLSIVWAAILAGAACQGSPSAEEVWSAIRDLYVDPGSLPEQRVREAVDTGEVGLLGTGVEIGGTNQAAARLDGPAWRTELVEGRYLFVRVRNLAKGEAVARLSAAVASNLAPACGVVLDLRGWRQHEAFEAGAELTALLGGGVGGELFSLVDAEGRASAVQAVGGAAGGAAHSRKPLVVLVNGQTSGVGEAVADGLRNLRGAVVVGGPTAGKSAVFAERTLKDGRVLRVAEKRVIARGGRALFPNPVTPDVAVEDVGADDAAAMVRAAETGVAEFVTPVEPTDRQDEAALVRGEMPEVDELRRRLEDAEKRGKEGPAPDGGTNAPAASEGRAPALVDETLARGFDILRAVEALAPRPAKGPGTVAVAKGGDGAGDAPPAPAKPEGAEDGP